MILDVDTGLIRGLWVAEDVPHALAQAVECALNKPGGTPPPGYPQRVVAAVGLGEFDKPPNSVVNRVLNLIPPYR